MKTFQERNPLVIGVVGLALISAVVLGSWFWGSLPFLARQKSYSAHFTEAGGLGAGAEVQVSGLTVGKVDSVSLDGTRVLVKFKIANNIRLGDRTEAAVKTKSLLGTKVLGITPRGDGYQTEPIPIERTTPAYQLPDALGELTTTISGLDTEQLSDSLEMIAETFHNTPPDLKAAVQGVGRFATTLNERDGQLRKLLADANKATAVLAERGDRIALLISDTNALLQQLNSQWAGLDQVSNNVSFISQQISGLVAENRQTLKPALEKLNGVLTIVDDRKDKVQRSIKDVGAYLMTLGEALSSGPFFNAYLVNLLPGQFVQPFIDAAFSDLGLDPNVLLPSERTDPQIGQPGTPPLPMPYPRTGQGGDPKLNLPDAITGKPGDPRYPYREPLPAPPPGGAPPGPPAQSSPAEEGR
ncbi:MAG: MCE family protein [Mycolicibacterium fortuitum]|uniref:MCE family protein n=1 Tax=Mycolicibacterium fortuitum TaxID=1766 RepID=UPI0022BA1204|nr:MCE family protein [Mycolicibacterium fortuitum]WAY22775.1 MCE family protein [Mycolicibacterium fortuitum]